MVKRALVEIDEGKCDGCGLCVPKCAEGAIKLVNGKARLVSERYCDGLGACLGVCPRDAIRVTDREALPFDEDEATSRKAASVRRTMSRLRNWPVQLNLVNPRAPFLRGASILLMADCVPVAHPDWQGELLDDKVVLVGCPKFDDIDYYIEKMGEILSINEVRDITLVHMEVPCCGGLEHIAREAKKRSKRALPIKIIVMGIDGHVVE